MVDETYMQQALQEARKAAEADEVPVGAVLVSEAGDVMAAAGNRVITDCDPTAHAEMAVIRSGCEKAMNFRLLNTTLYVTVEPCVMCMGAVVHARISRLVYGAADPKWGAAATLYAIGSDSRLNHRLDIVGGVCEEECRELMQDFFRTKRNQQKEAK
jgi:tRNA(adenine34) deaminase